MPIPLTIQQTLTPTNNSRPVSFGLKQTKTTDQQLDLIQRARKWDLHPALPFSKIILKKPAKNILENYDTYMQSSLNTTEHTQNIIDITDSFALKPIINDEQVKKVAQKDTSHIFIMNHLSSFKIGESASALVNKLYSAYNNQSKADVPDPVFMANYRLLKAAAKIDERLAKLLLHYGLRGVAPLKLARNTKEQQLNDIVLNELKDGVAKGTKNYFLFPEGPRYLLRYLGIPLKWRFKPGIAQFTYGLINKQPGKTISVVPSGFGKVDKQYSVFLQPPVEFSKTKAIIKAVQEGKIIAEQKLTGNDKKQKRQGTRFIKQVMVDQLKQAVANAKAAKATGESG